MADAARPSRDAVTRALEIAQVALAVIALPIGMRLAMWSLGIHRRESNYRWISRRYYMGEGWGWQIVDPVLVAIAAALLFPRLIWLVVWLVGRLVRRTLPCGPSRWDLLLVIPAVGLGYIVYLANYWG
jgi:hypothetical protein